MQLTTNDIPGYHLNGTNKHIRMESTIRRPPRLHHVPIPQWARNLAQAILADHCPSVITTDGSSTRTISDATELWTRPEESVKGRGAMVLSELHPSYGHRLLEIIRILDLPTTIADQSHLIELILHVAALQLAAALQERTDGVPIRVESDCKSIFDRAKKEFRKCSDRSLSTKPLAALFRIINLTARRYPSITSAWVKAHPEKSSLRESGQRLIAVFLQLTLMLTLARLENYPPSFVSSLLPRMRPEYIPFLLQSLPQKCS